ncbi:MAG: hypothetical protein ACLT1W_13240 [Alistipes onderdonkii]
MKTYASATGNSLIRCRRSTLLVGQDRRAEKRTRWAAVYANSNCRSNGSTGRFSSGAMPCRAYYVFVNGHQSVTTKTQNPRLLRRDEIRRRRTQYLALIAYAHPISTTLENRSVRHPHRRQRP